jgi:hypothetical protein
MSCAPSDTTGRQLLNLRELLSMVASLDDSGPIVEVIRGTLAPFYRN